MQIAIVNPNTTKSMTDLVVVSARRSARPDTELVGLTSSSGAASIESHVDEVFGATGVLEQIRASEALSSPPDAYVIACFGDTGLGPAREAARGPVVGMTEAALCTAMLLAHRFTIITLPRRTRAQSDAVVRAMGLEHRCAVRAVDVPVAAVHSGASHLFDTFHTQSAVACVEDGAEAIILGCAGLADLVEPLQDAVGLPIIEGVSSAVGFAEALVAQQLFTSRVATWAFASPPQERGSE